MNQDRNSTLMLGDNANSGSLYFEEAGEGEIILFSHAGFVDRRMWDPQWQRFAQDYRVIRYDLRGFGKSEPADAPVNRRDDLYRLLTQLAIERAVLIGCSMSGELVLDFALEHPELVAGLVLVSTTPGGFELQGEPPAHLMEMIAAIQQGELDTASDLQNRMWVAGPFRQPQDVDAQVWQAAAEMNRIALHNQTWFKMDAAAPFQLEPPAVQRLHEVAVPTLIVAGELDHPEILRAAEMMATAMPDAHKQIIPGSAHLPNMERPQQFNQVVLDFLQQQVW